MNNTLAIYNSPVSLVAVRYYVDKFPRVKDYTREEAVAHLAPIVYGAVLYNNQEISEDRLAFMASAIYEEIMADTKFGLRNLSWVEIGMVVRRAVIGGEKEMYGVSVASILRALVVYVKTEGSEAQERANQLAKDAKFAHEAEVTEYANKLAKNFKL